MRKINSKNRAISALLVGVMCLQMLPSTVLAIEAITVQEVLPLEQTEYTVDFGTAEKDLPLPEQLEIVALTDAELELTENTTAEVEWFGEYDAYVPGTYTFEAAFESRACKIYSTIVTASLTSMSLDGIPEK